MTDYPIYQNIELKSYKCTVCGKDLYGKVRIQNDVKKYVKCLEHGLGIAKQAAGGKDD
jgi:DNA-directed RNA polymerase subunit RPC12/RpoP